MPSGWGSFLGIGLILHSWQCDPTKTKRFGCLDYSPTQNQTSGRRSSAWPLLLPASVCPEVLKNHRLPLNSEGFLCNSKPWTLEVSEYKDLLETGLQLNNSTHTETQMYTLTNKEEDDDDDEEEEAVARWRSTRNIPEGHSLSGNPRSFHFHWYFCLRYLLYWIFFALILASIRGSQTVKVPHPLCRWS